MINNNSSKITKNLSANHGIKKDTALSSKHDSEKNIDFGGSSEAESSNVTENMLEKYFDAYYKEDEVLRDGTYNYAQNEDGSIGSVSYDENNDGKTDIVGYDNNGDGVMDSASYYYYNENGQMTSNEYDTDSDGDIDSETRFEYDKDGKIIESDDYKFNADNNNYGISSVTSYEYDDAGNLKSVINDGFYNPKESPYSIDANTSALELNSSNTSEKEEHLTSEGNVSYTEYNVYDENGNVISTEYKWNDAQEANNATVSYKYDENGNRISENYINEHWDTNSTTFYEYNDDGSLATTKFDNDSDGVIDAEQSQKYDADGNLKSVQLKDGSSIEYEYDKSGNMIAMKKTVHDPLTGDSSSETRWGW